MAKKKGKKAQTCENILFQLLMIPDEQIKLINKARKNHSFWDWFKTFSQTGKIGLEKQELDMNLNFTMTEVNESILSPNMYEGEGFIEGKESLKKQMIKNVDSKKKKVVKKSKVNSVDKTEDEVKLGNDYQVTT